MSDLSFGPWLEGIRRALTILASTADKQRQHLEELGVPDLIDELALEFDDMVRPLTSILAARGDGRALKKLGAVSDLLASSDIEWTVIALNGSIAWREVARDAVKELESLPEEGYSERASVELERDDG